MIKKQKWPDHLYIIRHGESAGNVARDAADRAGLSDIAVDFRDVDAPLSERGERQAVALGEWFGREPADRRPTIVVASTYLRALHTAELAFPNAELIVDERLREREFGVLDRLTKAGIVERFPEQNVLRQRLGKFYYRPPGGESWCDVMLRLRSFLEKVTREYSGERVAVVCHSVVVLCFRYLFDRLSEKEILEIDRHNEIANCSVTQYRFDHETGHHGKLVLERFNYVAPVEEGGEPVTREPDARPR